MMVSFKRIVTIVQLAGLAAAQAWGGSSKHWGFGPRRGTLLPGRDMRAPSGIQNGTFKQLIDHSNPHLGTFEQRFWWDTQYWKGPGSPVVMLNAGEEDASGYTGYCTNETITGLIAQRIGAATIVFEHRYWGTSSPFTELTTANLQYLTLENSIQDMINFARNVQLPFARHSSSSSNAQNVPWILVGGSYPGALAAYTASTAPGTFWAYLASSAPVQVISNFWQYFSPIQAGMPQNCSSDVSKVIEYMDNVLLHGSQKEITALKTKFGLQAVEHNDDFMSMLQEGPWLWQENSVTTPSQFDQWCDYVENAVNASGADVPGAAGVGLTKALDGFAAWMKDIYIPESCASNGDFSCFNSYDANNPVYTNISLNNPVNRAWMWVLCNTPFGFWQDGPPSGQKTLVSRLVTANYNIRQCGLYFPPGPQGQTYGIAKGATESQVNAFTKGWEIDNTSRLIFTNGEFDPWRSGSVSSVYRPGGPLKSSAQVPVNLIEGGVHCYDFITDSGQANAAIKAVQDAEVEQLAKWVAEWPRPGGYGRSF